MQMHKECRDAAQAEGRKTAQFVDRIIADPAGIERQVRINLGESPLSWLRARGFLSQRLYLAGEKLRDDWEAAGLGAHVTMHWSPVPLGGMRGGRGSASVDFTARQLSAKRRFDDALRHSGRGLADILWRVVCAGEGLAAAEKALGWPTRAGKLVLSFALERVAEYYRIS